MNNVLTGVYKAFNTDSSVVSSQHFRVFALIRKMDLVAIASVAF